MTSLLIIRHGPTQWNIDRRIQGRTDIPLSPHGRETVKQWVLPARLSRGLWYSSPLARATQTATLLGAKPIIEPRIAEMNWGEWEGRSIAELRAKFGDEMLDNEARGLDFRPPGGESPRDVQDRVLPWLESMAQSGEPVIAVTHKGVIRAIYALAAGWNMLGRPPVKTLNQCAHKFELDNKGHPRIGEMNIPLRPSAGPAK